jgi:CheY-like chemotaxis protein
MQKYRCTSARSVPERSGTAIPLGSNAVLPLESAGVDGSKPARVAGRTAVRAAACLQRRYSIVLSDMYMASMSGVELLARLALRPNDALYDCVAKLVIETAEVGYRSADELEQSVIHELGLRGSAP